MYDHQTESLWLQVRRRAVTGSMTGAKLKRISSTVTSWGKWKKRHPRTKVLALNTGYKRDYSKDPYEDYYQSNSGFLSFLKSDPEARDKVLIIGVELEGKANAYPMETLRNQMEISDKINGRLIKLKYDKATDTVTVLDDTGKTIDHMATYWMVWKGIYPETLFHGEEG
jgi:hypothetical protein